MPMLLHLPLEILLNIFKNLNLPDLYNLMLTCKDLKHLILSSNFIWRSVCRKKFIVHSSSDNGKLGNSSSYNCFRVSCNWCKGVYRNKIVVHHHTNYMPWLKFYNSGVLLLSVGSELWCLPTDKRGMPYHNPLHWKVEVPKVKRQDVRTNDISRFVVSENLIVCGNRDGSTTVLELDHIEQTPKVLYHLENCLENGQVEVSAVELIVGPDQSCAIMGSMNSPSLLLWHFNSEGPSSNLDWTILCRRDLRFSSEVGIRCLSLDDTKTRLAIGLKGNSKPALLDINTSQLMMTVSIEINRRESVRDIRWHDPNTIMVVTHSGKLQHIDARSHEVVFDMMDPFQSSLYCVKSDGERAVLAGTSEYSRCVLFDTRSDTAHVQMYFTQRKTSPVYSLDFDSTKLIAAADRSVAALNFDVPSHTTKAKDYSETFEFVYR